MDIREEQNTPIYFKVETNADDFSVNTNNANANATKLNKQRLELNGVNVGNCQVEISAKKPRHKKTTKTINFDITQQQTRITSEPSPGDYLMYVGESRTFKAIHNGNNATTNVSGNSATINYNNTDKTFTIQCNSSSGNSQVSLSTQAQGSTQKSIQFNIIPLEKKPFIDFSEDGCYLTQGQGYQVSVETNLPNLELYNTQNSIASATFSNKTLTIQTHDAGEDVFRLGYKEQNGGTAKDFKVLVNASCVTFNDKLYPKFEAYNGATFSLASAQLQGKCDSFEVEEASFCDYDENSKVLKLHDLIVGRDYKVRIIPIVSGEKLYRNASYITFKCVEPQFTEITLNTYGVALRPQNTSTINVTTDASDFEYEVTNKEIIEVIRKKNVLNITALKQGDGKIIIKARASGKLETQKEVQIKIGEALPKPQIILMPQNPIRMGTNKRQKLEIQLLYADRYTFTEKRRNIVSWDDTTKELVSNDTITSGTNYPYSYVEFIPHKDNIQGDMVYAEVEVIDITLTQLEINPARPELWEGDALTLKVTTDANDFTFETLDDKLQVIREGNFLKLQSTRGKFGNSQIRLKAQADGLREAVKTFNINIKDHSRITIAPDDRDITLEVGQQKRYDVSYNTTSSKNPNKRAFSISKEPENGITIRRGSGDDFYFTGATPGPCRVTLFGTKKGSHRTELVINANVIPAPATPIGEDKRIVSIPSVNQTATVTLTDASNVNIESTNRNVATSSLSGNTLTITGRTAGISHIRLWRTGQESAEVRVKVIVAKPAVLINGRLDPLWERSTNVNIQHPAVTYQNGADDYDFEIENPDQLEYNKANRTIRTKGTLVRGEIYKIKIIPKVQGVRQDVETCSYLQIKGQ